MLVTLDTAGVRAFKPGPALKLSMHPFELDGAVLLPRDKPAYNALESTKDHPRLRGAEQRVGPYLLAKASLSVLINWAASFRRSWAAAYPRLMSSPSSRSFLRPQTVDAAADFCCFG